jgi:hypothetical protein
MSYYIDAVEYRKVVCPILQDEWKVISSTMKVENATTGRLVHFDFVETICEENRFRDVIAIEIRNIARTKFWSLENQGNIKTVTVEMIVTKSEKVWL